MNSKKSIFKKEILSLLVSLVFISTSVFAQNSIKLTDPEIASVAVTANQIDVNYAELALKKNVSKQVADFANSMIQDHNSVIKMAAELAEKLQVTPKDNQLTQELLKGEKTVTSNLASLRGKAFEKAYVDNEVTYHEAVISTINNVLIPQTENKELKQLFLDVMPVLEAHLEHAQHLQSTLK